MKNIIALLVLLILSACSHKHDLQVTLPNTEMKLISSKENNVAYKLFVSLPEGYHTKGHHSYQESYPVLYLLDPDVEFGMAENIARTMVNYDTIKPFIIVGLAIRIKIYYHELQGILGSVDKKSSQRLYPDSSASRQRRF